MLSDLTAKVHHRNVLIGGVAGLLIIISLKLTGIDTEERKLSIKDKLKRLDVRGVITLIDAVC